ncbi:hypothetical protein NKJ08_14765 [Mesorhizobium sp. M0244]
MDIVLGLKAQGVSYTYEAFKFAYEVPSRVSTYTPDFILGNGIIVETKGQFVTSDRHKHLLIKKQYPDVDIRFVFSRSATRISKQSSTTYAKWCQTAGFQYADKRIPQAWIDEAPTPGRLEANSAIFTPSKAKRKKTPDEDVS